MKFVSWNVNGLRAVLKKDFERIFKEFDADIFAIQETKCQDGQVDLKLEGYHQFFNYAKRKGYSGTAVFSKKEPLQVLTHMWSQEEADNNDIINTIDNEGRVLALEYKNFWFVCVYTPNAQNELARIKPRLLWGEKFTEFCKLLESGECNFSEKGVAKTVVMCGDFNVAHNEIDLKNPKQNRGNAGFSDEERNDFTKLLDKGFLDSFRYLYPNKKEAYSWWSYRAQSRPRNVGWRIDYFLTSDFAKDKIIDSVIDSDIYGSDHCPISLYIDL